jgi:large subunit ribosomal protein L35Ae
MEAQIIQFRRGKTTHWNNQMIAVVDGVKNKEEATKLLKKNVIWQSPGKKEKVINGVVKATHGNSGALRIHFEKGMPGQAVGTKIQIK